MLLKLDLETIKTQVRHKKKSCELAIYYNRVPHTLSDFSFVIEKIINTTGDWDEILLRRERYVAAQLPIHCSLSRINYNSH